MSASVQFDAFGNPLSSSGTWKSPFAYAGQFGYQQDADTGLKLLGHRYYDSDTGRFLTRDRVKDSENRYGYCDNNPLTCFDANGLWKVTIFDLEFSGAVIAWRQHEHQHIELIKLMGSANYLIEILRKYVETMSHDNAPLEIDAENAGKDTDKRKSLAIRCRSWKNEMPDLTQACQPTDNKNIPF